MLVLVTEVKRELDVVDGSLKDDREELIEILSRRRTRIDMVSSMEENCLDGNVGSSKSYEFEGKLLWVTSGLGTDSSNGPSLGTGIEANSFTISLQCVGCRSWRNVKVED